MPEPKPTGIGLAGRVGAAPTGIVWIAGDLPLWPLAAVAAALWYWLGGTL